MGGGDVMGVNESSFEDLENLRWWSGHVVAYIESIQDKNLVRAIDYLRLATGISKDEFFHMKWDEIVDIPDHAEPELLDGFERLYGLDSLYVGVAEYIETIDRLHKEDAELIGRLETGLRSQNSGYWMILGEFPEFHSSLFSALYRLASQIFSVVNDEGKNVDSFATAFADASNYEDLRAATLGMCQLGGNLVNFTSVSQDRAWLNQRLEDEVRLIRAVMVGSPCRIDRPPELWLTDATKPSPRIFEEPVGDPIEENQKFVEKLYQEWDDFSQKVQRHKSSPEDDSKRDGLNSSSPERDLIALVESEVPTEFDETLRYSHESSERHWNQICTHSECFTSVNWYGREFTFTTTQKGVVRRLWEAKENGTPSISDAELLEAAGSVSSRLLDVFRPGSKRHESWGTMIIEAGKGIRKLWDNPQSHG